MTLQALAAPVLWARGPIHVRHAASVESCGTGSHVHRNVPVRASNARTSPLAASVRLLSATALPTTIRSLITAGGDVTSYSDSSSGLLRSDARRLTVPPVPNDAHGVPRSASSAIRRPSIVATITRLTHEALGCAGRRESTQYETPRLVKSPNVMFRSTFGSNFHSSRPVSGSSAITRPSGVLMNIRPSA